MDPNETLRLLLLALDSNRADEATEHAGNLLAWLRNGGFAPTLRRALPSSPRSPLVERRHVYVNRARSVAILTLDPNSTAQGFALCTYDSSGNEVERFPLARPEGV